MTPVATSQVLIPFVGIQLNRKIPATTALDVPNQRILVRQLGPVDIGYV